jgi:hypothetical protein
LFGVYESCAVGDAIANAADARGAFCLLGGEQCTEERGQRECEVFSHGLMVYDVVPNSVAKIQRKSGKGKRNGLF